MTTPRIITLALLIATIEATAGWPQLLPPNSEVRAANEWGVVATQAANTKPIPRLVWISKSGETLTDLTLEPIVMANLQFVRILNARQILLVGNLKPPINAIVVTLGTLGRWNSADYLIPADQLAQFRELMPPTPTGFYRFSGRVIDRVDFQSPPQ
jgi:hypothetical protein